MTAVIPRRNEKKKKKRKKKKKTLRKIGGNLSKFTNMSRCRKLCSDAKSGVNLLPWGASRTFPLMSKFARSSKSCDFSCVAKNRKSDDFSR